MGCAWGPDHWYNAVVAIDPASLPAGVRTEPVEEGAGITWVYFDNQTPVPLIVNPPDPGRRYFEPYPRPLTLRLVSGEAYFCDVMAKPMACTMRAPAHAYAAVSTAEMNRALAAMVRADDRPANVPVPAPQPFQFQALYGDRTVTIRGSVSFTLNRAYDPRLGAKTKKACDAIERGNPK
jgi:hypothetical protein